MKPAEVKPAIVFDLDGTLVDSLDDMQAVLNETLRPLGRPVLDRKTVGSMIGDGAKVLLQRALTATGGVPDDFTALLRRFLQLYEADAGARTRPYPGVPSVLDRLQRNGWALAICTNKPHAVTRRLLADLDLDGRFAAVFGGDSLPVGKPDPGPVIAALHAVGGNPRRAAMVGDHANDLIAGRAAGVATIFARYGYGGASRAGIAADATIDTFEDLPEALDGLFARAR
ncbi:MAG: phosphoglycolate phosphatase [Pseudolabrys sp.]